MSLGRTVALAGFIIGLAALVVQFTISIPAYMANGRSLFDAVVIIVSFFTILTNSVLVLIYLSELVDWSWLSPFRAPIARGMMVAVITLVMVFYHVILAQLESLQGLFLLTNTLMHYVLPCLYIAWWLAFGRRGVLRLDNIPAMLFPTLIYFVYVLGRGAVSHLYPYPTLDVGQLGFGHVLVNAVYICISLAVLCALVVLADKLLPRKSLGTAAP